MTRNDFPFAALVGQELLKTALILNAVDPSIGGVLIRGQKGTGKTTAVRSFRDLLPAIPVVQGCPYRCDPGVPEKFCAQCRNRLARGETLEAEEIPTPLVDLPLNATEDRLVGSLQVEEALRTGERRFEPGLLAAAHRGILYIDEVNLLEDHLVDLLLDAAATGVNLVEREGISHSHPASFILVGTMNPEEGELRPQFLDRFGLCVTVEGLQTAEDRLEVLRRRMDFDRDPEAFAARWQGENRVLARQIIRGRENQAGVEQGEEVLRLAARTAADAGAAGHRGEIGMMRAASALAAFTESPRVLPFHLGEAARLVLPHRMNQGLIRDIDGAQEKIDRIFTGAAGGNPEQLGFADLDREGEDFSPGDVPDEYTEEFGLDPATMEEMQVPGSMAAGSILFTFLKKKTPETLSPPEEIVFTEDLAESRRRAALRGREAARETAQGRGRYIRAAVLAAGERDYEPAVDATLRAAVLRRAASGETGPFRILPGDLRKKVRIGRGNRLVLFLVDASDSMSGREGLSAAKGAVLALLSAAYLRRDRVGLIAFRDQQARVLLPPTGSVRLGEARLAHLSAGGATPLAQGLLSAWRLIRTDRLKYPAGEISLVILSDGETNVPLSPGGNIRGEIRALGRMIQGERIRVVFVDTSPPGRERPEARDYADYLGAQYRRVRRLRSRELVDIVDEGGRTREKTS